MPLVRKELLEGYLIDQGRFGNTIRVHVSPNTHHFLSHLKDRTDRTYHDVVRVIINVYRNHPGFFDRRIVRHRKFKTLHVRLSRHEAGWCLDEAWRKGTKRAWFLGSIVNTFVSKVPKAKIVEVFENQLDRALRLLGEAYVG